MYLDLEYESRTSGQFQHRLKQLLVEVEQAYGLAQRDRAHLERYQRALSEILRLCNFNTVFLTPHFWPRYPRDEPLTFANYPFA